MQTMMQTVSPHATRSRPWEPWVELPKPTCPKCHLPEGDDGLCPKCQVDLCKCDHCGQYGYHVPDCSQGYEKARYFGVRVTVLQRFEHYALIRRPDGLSCVVETADLEEVRNG